MSDDQHKEAAAPAARPGLIRRVLAAVMTRRFAILSSAFVAGILFWGGFNTAMEWTNREEFCISCHEMKDNVYAEYRNTIHYQNRTGVRATCPDCHVPKEWGHKMIRKIQASNEVLHKILGTIDTPEKFNAKRAELAQHEWDRMKRTDSRECRNCHHFESMDYAEQNQRSSATHQQAFNEGKTCIDCHKGIAHTLPSVEQHIGAPKVAPADPTSPGVVNPREEAVRAERAASS
ncbi:periplasmic nitrate reductase subunit NapC [Sphaerotilus hippei]|uniref:Periplasmic nitrate reductase subunit NapC n=2 Tax=Sphaerotilus hippei TaxID=744406 RepID=A0A318GZM4_9BURK|nr:periplasmic nitrate reductase subunit NapC [Sphaerotilus hippei]